MIKNRGLIYKIFFFLCVWGGGGGGGEGAISANIKEGENFPKKYKFYRGVLEVEFIITKYFPQTMTMCSAFEYFMNGKGAI